MNHTEKPSIDNPPLDNDRPRWHFRTWLMQGIGTPDCVPFRSEFLTVLPRNAALLYSYVAILNDQNEDEDYWSVCTVDMVKQALGLNRDAQQTLLKTLTELGLIEIQKRGLPAKRHIRADLRLIWRLIAAAKGGAK